MSKVKIGVLGAYRGASMINYCKDANNAEIVAICDKSHEALEEQKKRCDGLNITFYDNFEDFIKHDMDAVVLANYAHEHAPFAIKAMKCGKHVYSEVAPVQNMKEAVELIETVEETGKVYAYGENYCYMNAPYEMKKLYEQGKIGVFEYGECEYVHNCEPIWQSITYGEEDHWRNSIAYSTFYCTHSLGPIIHITGLRPVSVIGIESMQNERMLRVGAKRAGYGIEMVMLENGGIIKSIHGGLYKNSVWYSVYGNKGRMECAREDVTEEHIDKLYVNTDEAPGAYGTEELKVYNPVLELDEIAKKHGHGGSDFYCMYHFVEKLKGNPQADIIDVYEAMDMFLPGLFAYRSILDGNAVKQIPNLRNKEERDQWRNDVTCTDPKVAGDMVVPTYSKGVPEIDPAVYERQKELWRKECEGDGENTYRNLVFSQGDGTGV